MRGSPLDSVSRWANSIAASADGHSRAWCSAMRKKTGRPSAPLTLLATSMPWISRPWNDLPITSGRTVSGWSVAVFLSSSWISA